MKILILHLLLAAFSLPAFSFQLSPMVMRFSPDGVTKTQVLTLENKGTEKVPVQIEITSRDTDSKGEEVRKPSDEFTIYPEQVVLLPGEKRNVRLTWNGKVDKIEKAYRVIASQVPVNFKEKNAKAKKNGVSLNFLLQYVASAYVVPTDAVADVKVKSVKLLSDKKLELVLSNNGTAHRVLKLKELSVLDGEKSVVKISEIKDFDGSNILAGKEKTFTISLTNSIKAHQLKASIELSDSGD